MMNSEALEGVDSKDDLTPEAQAVLDHDRVDLEHLEDRLTGRGDGLRSSKPRAQDDTELEQVVFRLASFHSGQNPSIPVTAMMDLQIWLDEQGIDASVSGIQDDAGEEIEALIDGISRILVAKLGHDPDGGIKRWQKALYGEVTA